MTYNDEIINYISNLKKNEKYDKSEVMLLLLFSSNLNNYQNMVNLDNNYADIVRANNEIIKSIKSKKYIKQYEKEKDIIDRIDRLYVLLNNYYSNYDVTNIKKEYNLKLVITCLEAFLHLDLTFPEYAQYYIESKILEKKGPNK